MTILSSLDLEMGAMDKVYTPEEFTLLLAGRLEKTNEL